MADYYNGDRIEERIEERLPDGNNVGQISIARYVIMAVAVVVVIAVTVFLLISGENNGAGNGVGVGNSNTGSDSVGAGNGGVGNGGGAGNGGADGVSLTGGTAANGTAANGTAASGAAAENGTVTDGTVIDVTASTGAASPDGGAWDGAQIRMPVLSVPYETSEETDFCLYMEYLAECSRDSFCLLNSDASEAFYKAVDFQKPALCKRGDYLLVSDIGGRASFLMKGTELLWEQTFTGLIVNASVSADGHIAYVIETPGYRNAVRVFAPIGVHLFDWIVADDYVLSSEVSPSGSEFMVSRLKTAGINLSSWLEFLDMTPEPVGAVNSFSEDIAADTTDSGGDGVILSARYLSGGSVAAVTADSLFLYAPDRSGLLTERFDSLMAMCEFIPGQALIAARRDNRTLLINYAPDPESENRILGGVLYETDAQVRNMYADDGFLLVNLGGEVTVFNKENTATLTLKPRSEIIFGGVSEKMGILIVTQSSADVYAF